VTGGEPLVRVENEVDFTGPPPGFQYINEYIGRDGVTIPDDPPLGCSCTDCFTGRKTCCAPQFNATFAYTAHRKYELSTQHCFPYTYCMLSWDLW